MIFGRGRGLFRSTVGSPSLIGTRPKWLDCKPDSSPSSSANVKNMQSDIFMPLSAFMFWCLMMHRDNYLFQVPNTDVLKITQYVSKEVFFSEFFGTSVQCSDHTYVLMIPRPAINNANSSKLCGIHHSLALLAFRCYIVRIT